MTDKIIDCTEVSVVSMGGKFCSCGGLMVLKSGNYLMTSPPKQEVMCLFCGNTDYVEAPYKIDIQFKKLNKR